MCERADSSVVSASGGQPAHRGSIPVGSNPGVARGYFPRGDRAGVYVCVCACVARQTRSETSLTASSVSERAVSIDAYTSLI